MSLMYTLASVFLLNMAVLTTLIAIRLRKESYYLSLLALFFIGMSVWAVFDARAAFYAN